MSNKRQTLHQANDLIKHSKNKLVVREIFMQSGEHDTPHFHPWHQLIFPRSGMLQTKTSIAQYYVPCNRAVLIPAGCIHESRAITPVQFIGVYIQPDELAWLGERSKTLEVSSFYKALIFEIVKVTVQRAIPNECDNRLTSVFCDQTLLQNEVSLEIIMPSDKRLKPITDALLSNPRSSTPLSQWANQVGASERTIGRLFEKQTGLSFRQWRQKFRLVSSLSMIEQNIPIQTVAYNVGYDSPSAFCYSFKKEFGVSPQQYFLDPLQG